MYLFTIVIFLLICWCYLCVKKCYKYWEVRRFPYLKPSFPFGNFKDLALQRMSISESFKKIYFESKDRFVGTHLLFQPILVICDWDLANRILIKDFQHFADRGFYCNEESDPISAHLFAMTGDSWKSLRGKLAPAFTSAKLKFMFPTMAECAYHLIDFLNEKAKSGEVFELQDLSARYSTDSIASIAFGRQINSVNNPSEKFRVVGKEFFEGSFKNAIRNAMMFLYPNLMKKLGIKLLPKASEKFFVSLIKETIEQRESQGIMRRDFMHSLLELRNSGKIRSDEEIDDQLGFKTSSIKSLTEYQMAAQAMVFFFAGFETSSTTIAFTIYELAKNPEIQKKVHQELDEVMRNELELTFENIMELKFLDACINEILRKYTPLPFLNRECTANYQIPDSDLVIEKGTSIIIPISGYHMDEKFYSEPEKFQPERFLETANIKQIHVPFGDGPRICVGPKVGFLQTKLGLTVMLQRFEFELSEEMHGNLEFDPKTFVCIFKNGIQVRVKRRD